jgi:hypothetical protein
MKRGNKAINSTDDKATILLTPVASTTFPPSIPLKMDIEEARSKTNPYERYPN